MTGGKPRFPVGPPCMVNNEKAKGLSRSHSTQPDQAPHTNVFAATLEAIPADDWHRTWAVGRTIMMRRTSKRVKEQVDKMLLPVVVRLRTTSFTRCWKLSDTDSAKLGGVLTQCPALDHLEIVGIRFDNDRTNTSVFDVVVKRVDTVCIPHSPPISRHDDDSRCGGLSWRSAGALSSADSPRSQLILGRNTCCP